MKTATDKAAKNGDKACELKYKVNPDGTIQIVAMKFFEKDGKPCA